MKKIIFIFTLCFIFCSTQLHAARFGGGKSFGQQRSFPHNSQQSGRQHQQQQQQHSPQQQHNNQMPPKSSWTSKLLPALAGLSVGAMLGSLLSGHSLGGGIGALLMMLLAAGVVFYIIKKFVFSRTQKQVPYFQNAAHQSMNGESVAGRFYQESGYSEPQRSYDIQSDSVYSKSEPSLSFAQEVFLRTAKTTFIRMQTAYDNKNLTDIRSFTTPEVFAEIQMQIQERGNALNHTEIIHINASILDGHEVDDNYKKVLFSGQVREQQNEPSITINEIWHFIKHENQWLIAGIEQRV